MALIASTNVFNVAANFHLKETEIPFSSFSVIRKRFGDYPQRNVILTTKRIAPILPKLRAQNLPDYVPDSKFYKVEAILRPWRILQVSAALLTIGIRGVTISDVKGFGAQGGQTHGGSGFSEFSEENFLAKVKMEIVVRKDQAEAVINTIMDVAKTGEIGDGKIFLIPVSDVIRIRTGEHGDKA